MLQKQKLLDTYLKMYKDKSNPYIPYTKDSITSRNKCYYGIAKKIRKPVNFPNVMVTN